MCPDLDHKLCTDSSGQTYGVLCSTRLSGTVITNSGKRVMVKRGAEAAEERSRDIDKRDYTETFDGCGGFCDDFDEPSAFCTGVSYSGGYCMAFAAITGTFDTPGQIAAIRQI